MSVALFVVAASFNGVLGLGPERQMSLESVVPGCPATKPICEESGRCFSLDMVKLHRYSDQDNIKSVDDVPGFEEIRNSLRGKHLRIRSEKPWFDIAGFYTYPLYVINQLLFAEKWGLIGTKEPFVYMPETHHYFDNCNDGGAETVDFWHRWFKPISSVADPNLVNDSDVWEFTQETIASLHHNKDAYHAYPYRMKPKFHPHLETLKGDAGTQDWLTCMRQRARPYIENNIAVKDHLYGAAKNFYQQKFSGRPTMGMHIRGTDKWINNIIDASAYTNEADAFLRKNKKGRIFLATDDPDLLVRARRRWGYAMHVRDSIREKGNVFYDDRVDKDWKCMDVLMDTLVLSMTSKLVKTWSAVSEFAVLFSYRFKPTTTFRVVELQLNMNKSANAESACHADLNASSFISCVGPNSGSLDVTATSKASPAPDSYYEDWERCSLEAPQIYSKDALEAALKEERSDCSRGCVAFRSRHHGAVPSRNMKGDKTALLVIAHWKENLAWTRLQPFCFLIMEKRGNSYSFGQDPSNTEINTGNEASSYLKFIVDHYDNLPDNLFMTHGDRISEHSVDLVPMLQTINPDSYEYASLNGINFPMVAPNDYNSVRAFVQGVIPPKAFPDLPEDFLGMSMSCCAQFMVNKQKIMAHPKEMYAHLHNFSRSAMDRGHSTWDDLRPEELDAYNRFDGGFFYNSMIHHDPQNFSSFTVGESFELTWHVLFGEKWHSTKVDSLELCGSEERCPQNLPIVRDEAKTHSFGIASSNDPFWAPCQDYDIALQETSSEVKDEVLGPNFLITTREESAKLPGLWKLLEANHSSYMLSVLNQPAATFKKGLFTFTNEIIKNHKGAENMSKLMASYTIKEKDVINILSYNDIPCGADFFGLRAEPYVELKKCGSKRIRLYSSLHRDLISQMDIVLISKGWGQIIPNVTFPPLSDKAEKQIWASCTLENGKTYDATPDEVLTSLGVDVLLSPGTVDKKKGVLPLSFYSHFYLGKSTLHDLRKPAPMDFKNKIKKVAVINAACKGKQFEYRNKFVEKFIKEMNGTVESIGRCWNNASPLFPWSDNGMGNRPMAFHLNKMANVRPYAFTLCHESIESKDWVTEKVYQALAVGSVPIYRGSKDIHKLVPCEDCVIDAGDFSSVEDLRDYVNMLMKDKDEYQKYLDWKHQPYEWTSHPDFEKLRGHSVDTAIVRLAQMAGRVEDVSENQSSHNSRSGTCMDEIYSVQRLSSHG